MDLVHTGHSRPAEYLWQFKEPPPEPGGETEGGRLGDFNFGIGSAETKHGIVDTVVANTCAIAPFLINAFPVESFTTFSSSSTEVFIAHVRVFKLFKEISYSERSLLHGVQAGSVTCCVPHGRCIGFGLVHTGCVTHCVHS